MKLLRLANKHSSRSFIYSENNSAEDKQQHMPDPETNPGPLGRRLTTTQKNRKIVTSESPLLSYSYNVNLYIIFPMFILFRNIGPMCIFKILTLPVLYLMPGSHWAFFNVADAFPMETDKHQAMFRRYNRTYCE